MGERGTSMIKAVYFAMGGFSKVHGVFEPDTKSMMQTNIERFNELIIHKSDPYCIRFPRGSNRVMIRTEHTRVFGKVFKLFCVAPSISGSIL